MGDKKKYWVGFNLVNGIGPLRMQRLLKAFDDVEYAWKADRRELESAGLGPKTIDALLGVRSRVDLDHVWTQIQSEGYIILTWECEEYPQRLREIAAPPPVLYTLGDFEQQDRWAVSVVGTRRMSPYGEAVTRDVGRTLAANGVTIVSGLARGIDRIAHEAALDAGGRTIAVLGSGLDQIYPPEHRKLAARITENGAVISDYPIGTRPEAKNFPPRNRIISGLSMIVIVVEAGEGSGALITADFAADQGREVFAVPGDIERSTSAGVNQLIQSGARPMLSASDVLEALNMEVASRQEIVSQALPEDKTERLILETLGREPLHVDELMETCALPIAQITAALAMLELKGRVRKLSGMQYVKIRETQTAYQWE
jgi:DNA processing protein